ncbi:MAG: sulfotransferase [Candidatus Thiodiazotropha sp.]
MKHNNIIIIGAPRSGTNMLRDVLCRLDNVATWPCDEINYIWRHGNIRYPSDEFSLEMATPEIASFIRKQFDWVAQQYHANTVIEKTCANSLRVPFVNSVVPDAKYIFIHRDGLDVVGSALKRWKAPLDMPYLIKKARFVPLSDLPYYASKYLFNRIYRLISKENRLAFWGPRLSNMDELLINHNLEEICALQWQACVEKSIDALEQLPSEQWIKVGYEDLVTQPESVFSRIADFLQLSLSQDQLKSATQNIRADSVGKGRAMLSQSQLEHLSSMVSNTMIRLDY